MKPLAYLFLFLFFFSLYAQEAPMAFYGPVALGSHQGVYGNPASLSTNSAPSYTLGFSLKDKDFNSLRLGYESKNWGIGYRLQDELSSSEYILSLSENLSKTSYMGSKITYVNSNTQYVYSDLGLQWEWGSAIKWGVLAEGLFGSKSLPDQRRYQTLSLGLRPLAFLSSQADRLTAIYQVRSQGYTDSAGYRNPFSLGTHKIFADLQPFRSLHLQASKEVIKGNDWTLGAFVQFTPNQFLGGYLHSKNKIQEYVNQYHVAKKKHHLAVPGQVMILDLNRNIIEGRITSPWFIKDSRIGALDLLKEIKAIEHLKGIKLLIIKTGRTQCSPAVASEIRKAIVKLKQKRPLKVIAYLENTSRLNYLLATAADKIVIPPSSYFDVRGYASEITFYKGLLEKAGIEAQFIKHGNYKAYPEIFTRTEMSKYWSQNLQSTLNSLWEQFLIQVAQRRHLNKDSLELTLSHSSISLEKAVEAGLIDTMLYEDQLIEYGMGKKAMVYKETYKGERTDDWGTGKNIAVIYMSGAIMSGQSRGGGLFSMKSVGSETIIKQIKRVRQSAHLKALILRVESPGGSAIASDLIYRELDLLRESGKPIILSVGSTCASGCYYIAAAANHIVAGENSIVGSIGIFGGKFVATNLFQKLGITKQTIMSTPHADAHSINRKWDSTEVEAIRDYMDTFYTRFANIVSKGRGFKENKIDSLGGGRIFTGAQGVENGLVDKIGGFAEAVTLARKSIGIRSGSKHHLVFLNGVYSPTLFGNLKESQTKNWMRDYKNFLSDLQETKVWALSPEALSLINPSF